MLPEKQQLLKSLEKKHRALDKEIEQLYKHTHADLSLKKLKKQKLMLKEQIETIKKGETNG